MPFDKDGYFRTNRYARLGHWNPAPSLSPRNYRSILASYRLSEEVNTHKFCSKKSEEITLEDIRSILNQKIDDPIEKNHMIGRSQNHRPQHTIGEKNVILRYYYQTSQCSLRG